MYRSWTIYKRLFIGLPFSIVSFRRSVDYRVFVKKEKDFSFGHQIFYHSSISTNNDFTSPQIFLRVSEIRKMLHSVTVTNGPLLEFFSLRVLEKTPEYLDGFNSFTIDVSYTSSRDPPVSVSSINIILYFPRKVTSPWPLFYFVTVTLILVISSSSPFFRGPFLLFKSTLRSSLYLLVHLPVNSRILNEEIFIKILLLCLSLL